MVNKFVKKAPAVLVNRRACCPQASLAGQERALDVARAELLAGTRAHAAVAASCAAATAAASGGGGGGSRKEQLPEMRQRVDALRELMLCPDRCDTREADNAA